MMYLSIIRIASSMPSPVFALVLSPSQFNLWWHQLIFPIWLYKLGLACCLYSGLFWAVAQERCLVYRVTHHVGQNLPLTSKQKFRFGLVWPGLTRPKQNFFWMSTGGFGQRDGSPCCSKYRVTHHVVQNLPLTTKQKFCFGQGHIVQLAQKLESNCVSSVPVPLGNEAGLLRKFGDSRVVRHPDAAFQIALQGFKSLVTCKWQVLQKILMTRK